VKTITLIVLLLFSIAQNALSCTLWSASGDYVVKGGGTLIAKNRDWVPDHRQVLKTVTPKTGYRYFGIFAEGNDDPGLKAGINEKGLVVVSSTAGSIPAKLRAEPGRTKNLMVKILREFDGVDSALKDEKIFVGPRNLMLADGIKIAVVEIGLNGKQAVTVKKEGVLTQTNHYLDEKLLKFNQKIGLSSSLRHKRIEELLRNQGRPYVPDDFIAMSGDREDGPDNGIWRSGSTPKRERTLSTWIVHSPVNGSTQLYVKIANPNENEKIHRLKLEDLF
jgi:hypothetical protein